MPSTLTAARQNHLLASLPDVDLKQLLPHLTLLSLSKAQVLYRPGTNNRNVYFPLTAIVSVLHESLHAANPEVAAVGNEGMVGIAAFLSGETSLGIASVESPGYALRLPSTTLRKEFRRAGNVQKQLLRYTQALTSEMAQTLACLKGHTLHQSFCRWLLMRFDRLPNNTLRMTQESIAGLLGVRRSGISEIANALKADHLIAYSRGSITLLDRPGLEQQSCDCYRIIRGEFERLLPD